MNLDRKPQIVQPGAGQGLAAFGNLLTVMLSGETSGDTISVMSEQTPPGGGPPLHVHSREDEIFLIQEGRIEYFHDGGWIEVAPGGMVYLPRGVVHTYRNIGDTPSRHWIITLPSGFERFFAACAVEFAKSGGPDPDQIVKIHHDFGIELLEPSSPPITAT